MGEKTAISWCDHTHNLWWGCWKIAPECENCYADDLANRYAPGHWGRTAPRRFFPETHVKEIVRWNKRAERDGVRRRVFVGSMCDWAERHPDPATDEHMRGVRGRFFDVAGSCTSLDFLMLTKRPESAAALLPWGEFGGDPWPNFWIGTSAGTVRSLATKVPELRSIRAAKLFISCEPLLENIPRRVWDDALGFPKFLRTPHGPDLLARIDWLIVGNESGHKRRPAELDWVRTARDAAEAAGVAFHFKQWVEPNGRKIHLPMLDERQHAAFPAE